MSRLFQLIDDYRAQQGGMSESAFARKARVQNRTLNGWRNRGMHRMPDRDVLERIARALGKDYETVVLPAVLADLGWVGPKRPTPPTPPSNKDREASA